MADTVATPATGAVANTVLRSPAVAADAGAETVVRGPAASPPLPSPAVAPTESGRSSGADAVARSSARADESVEATRSKGASPAASLPGGSVPRTLGRYRLLALLGAGGMGRVWKAHDPTLDRVVALKQILDDLAGGPAEVERFLRESRLAARLKHPGIVAVYDAGAVEGNRIISMEYVPGRTLSAWRAESRAAGAADEPARLRGEIELLAQVAEAVGYAHAQGVIHRDLKPANVLVDEAGRARVTDFGLAKEADGAGPASAAGTAALTHTGQLLGTPAYMSPEQARGAAGDAGPRSDVWSLGVMLYEALTGRQPFVAESVVALVRRLLTEDAPPPRTHDPRVARDLEALCLRALDRDPQGRFANAGEFAAELRRWLGGEPLETRPAGAFERAGRWARRRRRALAAAGLALALCAGTLGWAAWQRRQGEDSYRATLGEIARLVVAFEDSVLRTPMSADARGALAEQPLSLLDAALRAHPESGAAHAWRGRVKEMSGDRQGAARDYDRAVELDPSEPWGWYLRGEHLIRQYASRRPPWMVVLNFGKLERVEPRPEIPVETAIRERALADLARAESVASASDRPLGAREIALVRSLSELYSGDPRGPERTLALLESCPADPGVWRVRGQALYMTGHVDEAREQFRRTLAEWPEDEDSWFQMAMVAQATGLARWSEGNPGLESFREAVHSATEAIVRTGPHPKLLAARGLARLSLGDELQRARSGDARGTLQAAMSDFSACLEKDPNEVAVIGHRSICARLLATEAERAGEDPLPHLERARADAERAVARLPDNPLARWPRAQTLLEQARHLRALGRDAEPLDRRALADLEFLSTLGWEAPEFQVVYGEALLGLAWADAAHGRPIRPRLEEALGRFAAGLRGKEGGFRGRFLHGVTLHWLARDDRARGTDPVPRLREARAAFDAAIARVPDDVESLYDRGCVISELAREAARRGEDPLPLYQAARADLAVPIRERPERELHWHARGSVAWDLGLWQLAHGGDATSAFEEAAGDFAQAARRGRVDDADKWPRALRLLGRFDEALAACDELRRLFPSLAARLDGVVEDVRRRRELADGEWADELRAGQAAMYFDDFPAARERYAAGLARFAADVAALPEDERARRRVDPNARYHLCRAHYNLATIEATRSTGRARPSDPPAPVPAEEAERLRVEALRHVADAIRAGWPDPTEIRDDPLLEPLARDPRFAKALAGVGPE